VRHVVIGTAGHVDHGKTALVHALTGVMTDRLPEEQRRGITIELGFAPWRLSDDLLVSVIDAPGHRRLVHHMIAGASGIDIVLLVVAADEGVMPQTREHIAACRLLGVDRAVVAITKIDRVERELAELAADEARELLDKQGIRATTVLCSARSGDGLGDIRDAMLSAVAERPPRKSREPRARLGVDRVFTIRGAGTVVTGTLVEGSIELGCPLRILGPARELAASARALHVHGEPQNSVSAPTRLAINLAGVSHTELERGDVITTDRHATPTRVIDVWLESTLEPVRRGFEGSLFIGTARSSAKVQPIGEGAVASGAARLRLGTPMVVVGGDRFVLRGARVDAPSGAVVGGGVVLDAHPPRSPRAVKRRNLLTALHGADATTSMRELALEHAPEAVLRSRLPSRFALEAAELEHAAEALVTSGALVKVAESGWLAVEAARDLEEQALTLVRDHHKNAPLESGLKLQTLREQLARHAGEEAAACVLGRLTGGKKPALVGHGDSLRLPGFQVAAGDATAARALEKVARALETAGLSGMGEHGIGELLGPDGKQLRAVLAALGRDGKAIKSADLWFSQRAIDGLRTQVAAHFARHDVLTIQQFKELTGLGRKQTIPLLEHLDRLGVTKRRGADRVKGA
jgi:selenocysteine-specific elongation factor